MEQYYMPKKLDFENLRLCLDNYPAENIFIRLMGSFGGTVKVNEDLKGKTLDFKKKLSGLHMLIDSEEVFHFPLKDYYAGFAFSYERFEPYENGQEINLSYGIDPYDPNLPEPRNSVLRTIFDYHLMEISFEGRIDLKFHSWRSKPDLKYWMIDKSKLIIK